MKKTIKWVLFSLGVLACCLLAADITLRVMSKQDWVKQKTEQQLSQLLGREVHIGHMSVSLFGLRINNVTIAKHARFGKGDLISIDWVSANYVLSGLLKKHLLLRSVSVGGLQVEIKKDKAGILNIADLLDSSAPATPTQDDPLDWRGTIDGFFFDKASISYLDEATGLHLHVTELYVQARQIFLGKKFTVGVHFSAHVQSPSLPAQEVSLAFLTQVDLKNLDLNTASLKIKKFSLRYRDALLQMQGVVENLESPAAKMHINLSGLTPYTLADFLPEVPDFTVNDLNVDLQAKALLAKKTVLLEQIALDLSGVKMQASGQLFYGGAMPAWEAQSSGVLDWKALRKVVSLLNSPYQTEGTLKFESLASNKSWRLRLAADDLGARVPEVGVVKEVDFVLEADGIDRARLSHLSGKFNEEPFEGDLDWQKYKNYADLTARFNLKAFVMDPPGDSLAPVSPTETHSAQALPAAPEVNADAIVLQTATLPAQDQPTEPISDQGSFKNHAVDMHDKAEEALPVARTTVPPPPVQSARASVGGSAVPGVPAVAPSALLLTQKEMPFGLPPVNVKVNIQSGRLYAHYVETTGFTLALDLTGVTPNLAHTTGYIDLAMEQGKILDVNKLTNANGLTRALFMSLSLVSRVINSLSVFDLIDKLAKIMAPQGEEGALPKPQSDGTIEFESFDTRIEFTGGRMDVKKGSFVSPFMSLKLGGWTDFATGQVKLKAHAAPGKHDEDGIMPIAITIGGTMDQPQGKLSMLSSVTSLLTQTLSNNVASATLKKGVGGLMGLFKTPEPPVQVSTAADLFPGVEFVPEEESSRSTATQRSRLPAQEAFKGPLPPAVPWQSFAQNPA